MFFFFFFFFCATAPQRARASSFSRFLDHTQRRTTVGRTPLDEWSVRRRDLYLTTHNTQNRQTSTPPAGFEPTISAGERPQTYTLDRAATETGSLNNINQQNIPLNYYFNLFMSSTCFEHDGSSSGRRLYIQVWWSVLYMHQYKQCCTWNRTHTFTYNTAYTDAFKTHYIINVHTTVFLKMNPR